MTGRWVYHVVFSEGVFRGESQESRDSCPVTILNQKFESIVGQCKNVIKDYQAHHRIYRQTDTHSHIKSSNSPHPKCVSLDCGRRQDCVENTRTCRKGPWYSKPEPFSCVVTVITTATTLGWSVTCDPDSVIFLSVILKGWNGNMVTNCFRRKLSSFSCVKYQEPFLHIHKRHKHVQYLKWLLVTTS